MNWYYVVNGEQHGPVPEEELRRLAKEQRLGADDLVWNETMGDQWATAGSVPDLIPEAPPRPTTSVTREVTPPPPEAPAGPISCVDPVGPAWDRMKAILFRPFGLEKWFALGLSAWLTVIGQGSGGGVPNVGGNFSEFFSGGADVEPTKEAAADFFSRYAGVLIPAGVALVLVGIVLWLVFLWLRSRGRFMFLDNVVHNRALASEPWKEFKQHGNSLFRWNVVFSLLCWLVGGVLVALLGLTVVWPLVDQGAFPAAGVFHITVWGLMLALFAIVAGYITMFLNHFIVPIMYRYDLTATEAWRHFMPLLKGRFGGFVVYGLFYLVLTVFAQILVGIAVLITCCTLGCLLALPYIRAVVVLPVLVYFRAYSLEYLAQFGPEYDLFTLAGGDETGDPARAAAG